MVALVLSGAVFSAGAVKTVLLTGATGRTGVPTYKALQALPGVSVRALTRSADKAREVLGCDACDESEGIFIGDVMAPESMTAAMDGADTLVITVGTPEPKCFLKFFDCKYPKGAAPSDIDFAGAKNQIAAFAGASGAPLAERHVVLMSTTMTTQPNSLFDRLWGHSFFYHLNGEAALMSSGLGWTIVKACSLSDGEPGKHRLKVGHDDEIGGGAIDHDINRADVAEVLAAAVADPSATKGLRFDVCMEHFKKPTGTMRDLFNDARMPWDDRAGNVEV